MPDSQRDEMEPIADRLATRRADAQPVELGGRVGGVEVEPGRAEQWELADGVWMCQTQAPRARQLSVIAAANRPEETLVIAPDVVDRRDRAAAGHHHVHGLPGPFMSLARTGDAELA